MAKYRRGIVKEIKQEIIPGYLITDESQSENHSNNNQLAIVPYLESFFSFLFRLIYKCIIVAMIILSAIAVTAIIYDPTRRMLLQLIGY